MICLIDKIAKSFGGHQLYTGATLALNAGERWALVGPNGAGKTTLLNIIMGKEAADDGAVSFAKDVRIGYLEQETELSGAKSALQELIDSATDVINVSKQISELEVLIAGHKQDKELDELLKRYSEAQERFERLGGYELESKARQILAGLGFSQQDFNKTLCEFSGGWQMRISFAKLLLKHPDLLLLDEPTNHLDLESVIWLEQFIASYDGAVLLVSHDRSFMDACVSHVASLENKRLMTYTGNYSSYIEQREENLLQLKSKRAAQERDIAHMQTFIDRFRYKPTKAKQVQDRIKRVEKIKKELVVLPEQSNRVHFSFPEPPRTGDLVVSLDAIAKSYGDSVVYKNVSLNLYRGDHVALVGPNGAGKSTLMKLIAGIIEPDVGHVSYGQNVSRAYYAQHQLEQLIPANTVLSELDSVAPSWTSQDERKLLGAFLFKGTDVEKRVSVLSGGERARLALAKMLVSPDPLLLLDEPTNHLDIDSVAILEQALVSFKGTIVLISHDEHLVRSLSNKIIDIRDHTVNEYSGDYDYYLYKREALDSKTSSELIDTHANHAKTTTANTTGRNVKTKEQRRKEAEARNAQHAKLKGIKQRIREVEAALQPAQARYAQLMEDMADEALYNDATRFDTCMTEYNALSKKIPALEAEWLELNMKLEEETQDV